MNCTLEYDILSRFPALNHTLMSVPSVCAVLRIASKKRVPPLTPPCFLLLDWDSCLKVIDKMQHKTWVQFSRSDVSASLRLHGVQHARPPRPSPTPWPCSDSCPSSRWCHPTVSSSVVPFSSCVSVFYHILSQQSNQEGSVKHWESRLFSPLFLKAVIKVHFSISRWH